MPIEFDNDNIGEVYFGTERIGRVYYGNELVFERQVAPVLFSGNINYNFNANISGNITPTSYTNLAAGTSISYSGTLIAALGFEFSPGVTSRAVSGTVNVPAGGGNITVDLTGITVTMINDLEFNQGVNPNTFAVDINGMLSIDVLRNDITVMFASADADFMNGQFPQETQNTTRNVTVSFVVPAGFSNTGATLSMILTAVQPGTAPSAVAGTLGNFVPSLTDIPAAGVTNGTHNIDVTPDNGQWVVTATGAINIARNGGGDRASVSWSIPATTAARNGVITLSDDMNNVLNTYNYNQLAGVTDTIDLGAIAGSGSLQPGGSDNYTVSITSQTGPSAITYLWEVMGDGSIIGSNTNSSVNVQASNTPGLLRTITITVTATKGAASDTVTRNITII